jgi:hypothetical protein
MWCAPWQQKVNNHTTNGPGSARVGGGAAARSKSSVVQAATLLTPFDAKPMTNGGRRTGMEATRVRFYFNSDSVYVSYTFNGAGRYRMRGKKAESSSGQLRS